MDDKTTTMDDKTSTMDDKTSSMFNVLFLLVVVTTQHPVVGAIINSSFANHYVSKNKAFA